MVAMLDTAQLHLTALAMAEKWMVTQMVAMVVAAKETRMVNMEAEEGV